MILEYGLIILGLGLLYFGAEGLVKTSSSIAARIKMPPIVIGLTIVAFGTSMPELIVSVQTSIEGNGAISLGNVIGSNIFNIGVILGIAALIYPLDVESKIVKSDTPIMIFSIALFGFFFIDQKITRLEGLFLFTALAVYTFNNFYSIKKKNISEQNKSMLTDGAIVKYKSVVTEIVLLIIFIGLLIYGAKFFVSGSVSVASVLGLKQSVIGLTIVSFGTSLPELATSVVAALRKKADLAVGNVIGSNIFNVLGIVGMSSIINPIEVVEIGMRDFLTMTIFSLILLPFVWTKLKLERWEGILLLFGYLIYFYLLIN